MEYSPYASPASAENNVHNTIPERRQQQHSGRKPSASSQHMTNVPSTPKTQARIQPPTSAPPPRSKAQFLLTSPEATRRSKESLETFKVARTLKEGLLRLKARVDPQATPSMNMTTWRRPMRTFSATTASAGIAGGNNNNAYAGGATSRRPLLRHHSEIPRCMSMRSPDRQHSRAPSAASPKATAACDPALMPVFMSPKSRPTPLHLAHSCPQHRLVGRTSNDGPLLSPASNRTKSQPHKHHRDTINLVPKFTLDQVTEEFSCSTAQRRLRKTNTADTINSANGSTKPQIRPRTPEDESSQHSEVAEAAEAMILFMKSETSSQNDLSTSSLSPPYLNHQSPLVSPLIPNASKSEPFPQPDDLSSCNSSVNGRTTGGSLGGEDTDTKLKRPRPVSRTPSSSGDISSHKRIHVDN
ncbi:hypothetical protein IW140_002413 [Coemansia sp. RSA 1813]|nr:hypothetical protein EV178_000913 [Coemansia sp. RSA 1646]KAJ1773017.1 hypothetical protein LPJ74_000968 [Coemansia sp. RSA 1843]KAJ2092207.1 hypothetical protein IW138_001274 [Coemansia sp. RSA 986]KAJ2215343.1 hypothetical protein EV179_002291 [Coemansia sp. RSA 487]KAJ2570320.1 hypothetical protein IW140_002413 [Coemansia sp. RSA 1813]